MTHTNNNIGREEGGIIRHDQDKAPKTGEWKFMTPEVDEDVCIGCTTCEQFCPEACIEMVEKADDNFWGNSEGEKKKKIKKISKIDYEWCKGCGVCAQVCPVKAIFMKK